GIYYEIQKDNLRFNVKDNGKILAGVISDNLDNSYIVNKDDNAVQNNEKITLKPDDTIVLKVNTELTGTTESHVSVTIEDNYGQSTDKSLAIKPKNTSQFIITPEINSYA